MYFSVIIAIYNRKEELEELLYSLAQQSYKPFEVIVVDDGSEVDLKAVVENFEKTIDARYYRKENTGPGLSRNFGAGKAQGEYLIFLDSDCIVENNYLQNIKNNLQISPVDAFGGNDKAHVDFDRQQKAISYAMTSVFTTGGIRGKESAMTKFQPRSFNMGIRKEVFEAVGGFSDMRIGEDPDLSLRLWEEGYQTAYFANIGVYHKRRNNLKSFGKQVYLFGIARPILNQRHPKYHSMVFWFPTVFWIGLILALLLAITNLFFPNLVLLYLPLCLYAFYALMIFLDASIQNKSIPIGLLSVYTSFLQLTEYGRGFLLSWWKLNVLKQSPKQAFPKHFYF